MVACFGLSFYWRGLARCPLLPFFFAAPLARSPVGLAGKEQAGRRGTAPPSPSLTCSPHTRRVAKNRAEEVEPLAGDMVQRWEAAGLPAEHGALLAFIEEKARAGAASSPAAAAGVRCAMRACGLATTGAAAVPPRQAHQLPARPLPPTMPLGLPPAARVLVQQAEADAMLISNPAALRQYNERCKQVGAFVCSASLN